MIPELPDAVQRDRLVAALANVTRRLGWRGLLESPQLTTDDARIAEVWEPDVDGAARVLARLAAHAGLGDLDLELRSRGNTPAIGRSMRRVTDTKPGTTRRRGSRASRRARAASVSTIGASTIPQHLFGTLAPEIAHACRERAGVVAIDRELEERLTDVTTVWLGFGALTLAASERYRTGHSDDSDTRRKARSGPAWSGQHEPHQATLRRRHESGNEPER